MSWNPEALHLAQTLGGSLLAAPGGHLLLVERLAGHGLPTVAVLGRAPEDLVPALEAAAALQARGVPLNLAGLLPLGCDLDTALRVHRRRIGALVAALDAGLPWLENRPMLPRRLPGCVASPAPVPLAKAPLGPLEKAELKAFLPDWDKARRKAAFRLPPWRETEDGFEADLWPGVPVPEGAGVRVPPLELPVATPLSDALRAALRATFGRPIPLLPLPGDPAPLHALRLLTREAAAFRGPAPAWERALEALARLPAPPHFCARC